MVIGKRGCGEVRFAGSQRVVDAVDNAIKTEIDKMNPVPVGKPGEPTSWSYPKPDKSFRDACEALDMEWTSKEGGFYEPKSGYTIIPTLTIHDDGSIETNFGGDVSKLGYWSQFATSAAPKSIIFDEQRPTA